eukprot:CAMPEP_0206445786 /NCGR_PEP_ID=MMETSP0324_2-20121206/15727_1 /ASSEMBLY_ACC=CAM_ASM_000836 /TAXON_ID=2866 /ORGANISM="Crypthecodinium cohnii, Strain Seligo" /LENGTH=525 /DNA_ID=CAMNT_0053914091 /DNA_START=177 /DNA_END=1754 /DNA_ORIENTATION=-
MAANVGCCGGEEEPLTMGYMGAGRGSYIQETTYKFVGHTKGDFQINVQKKGMSKAVLAAIICGAILALLALAALIWFLIWSATTTTTMTFQCHTNDDALWSTVRREYCCANHGIACKVSDPFDCDAGLVNSVIGWSDSKRNWCCTNKQKGCSLNKAVHDYDCDAGLSNWEHGWSDSKKSWCCAHKDKGCTPKCLTENCDATCYHDVDHKGHGHVTCRDRVDWAKENVESNSLLAAINLVNKECSCQCSCNAEDFTRGAPQLQTCLMWGATHFKTFDGEDARHYGEGIAWIVKAEKVKVQSRFLETEFSNGMGAMHDIVFSGSFIGDHKLEIGALNGGKITWDGNAILEDYQHDNTFDPDGYGKIIYDDQGQLVDDTMENLPQRIVHINFEPHFYAQVFRWDNHLNVRIRMPQILQDGLCGNHNGIASDDARREVVQRLGAEVGRDNSLFETYTDSTPGKRYTLADCPAAKLIQAKQECSAIEHGLAASISNKGDKEVTQDITEGCVYDVCFAGQQYAESDMIEGW